MKSRPLLVLLCLSAVSARGQNPDPRIELPAVSAINGKLDANVGDYSGDSGGAIGGVLSAPLGERFGLQLDGLYTNVDNNDFYGAGVHLFWRNPDQGLIGLTAAGVTAEFVDTYEAGVEVEYYWNRFTLGMRAGVARIKYDFSAPFIDTDKGAGYLGPSVGYYPIDDLLLTASFERRFDLNLYRISAEYALPVRNLALTADWGQGENDYDHVLVGLRYYFGANKTLRERHRQDDPQSLVPGALYGVGSYGAEYNRLAREYLRQYVARNGGGTGSPVGSIPDVSTDVGGVVIGGAGSVHTGGSLTFGAERPGGIILPGSGTGALVISGSYFSFVSPEGFFVRDGPGSVIIDVPTP